MPSRAQSSLLELPRREGGKPKVNLPLHQTTGVIPNNQNSGRFQLARKETRAWNDSIFTLRRSCDLAGGGYAIPQKHYGGFQFWKLCIIFATQSRVFLSQCSVAGDESGFFVLLSQK